ncbi:HK97 family phage prohead protease [Mesorhizobium sp. M0615]|uniref:HK97 family phage prohead protease n=1 Tax=Mesorhizobium sp. M0615 TaxID=2956971 RepID=UPI00333D784C
MRDQLLSFKEAADRFFAAPVEVKFASDQGVIDGYGSVFGVRDQHGDVVLPGAFTKSIQQHAAFGTRPVMLWQHDIDRPIGVWDSYVEDSRGLKMSGRLNMDVQAGRETFALLKQGAIGGLSIGYRVGLGGAEIDTKTGVRRLKELALHEVSVTAFPSNRSATIDGVKSFDTRRDFETFLRDSGVSRAAATKLAAGGWPALSTQDNAAAIELAAAVKSAIAELKGTSK